jgi:hypothetical protein
MEISQIMFGISYMSMIIWVFALNMRIRELEKRF